MFGKKTETVQSGEQQQQQLHQQDALLVTIQNARIKELEDALLEKEQEIKSYEDAHPRMKEMANEIKKLRASYALSEATKKTINEGVAKKDDSLNRCVEIIDTLDAAMASPATNSYDDVHKMVQQYKKEIVSMNVASKINVLADIVDASKLAREAVQKMDDLEID
ncbi:hypothetical protein [Microcystis phage Mel-JY01]